MVDPHFAPTIRRRLLLTLLAPLSALLAIGVVFDYASGTAPVGAAYDQALANEAIAIAARVQPQQGGTIKPDLPPQAVEILRADKYDSIFYLVLGPHDEFVAGDPGLPIADDRRENPAFRDAIFDGREIRAASYRHDTVAGKVNITVAETTNKRVNARRQMLTGIILTDTLQFAAILVLVWLGVRYGLRPLLALRDQIASRSAHELAPLDESHVPGEVRPLTRSLNRLFGTVREAALVQQKFLADAAHQLRTPLAGLQTQLELLTHDPAAAALRDQLNGLHEGARRLAHTANQLLALARAEPSANPPADFKPVDLRELADHAVSQHFDRALQNRIDLGVEAMPARVRGSEWLLQELLTNLVDNALAYTNADGQVTVRTGISIGDAGLPFLEVEDNGPGIALEDRTRVLGRFYRASGSPGNGCGLGLAIVDEISRVHRATLEIHSGSDGRGTLVRVIFPLLYE